MVLKTEAEILAKLRIYSKKKVLFNLGQFVDQSFGANVSAPVLEIRSEHLVLFSFEILTHANSLIMTVCDVFPFPLYIWDKGFILAL